MSKVFSKKVLILAFLNLVAVAVIEFSKLSEYRVALLLALFLFILWSFSGERADNPKQLLAHYWENLKLSSDLAAAIAITILVAVAAALILAYNFASNPAFRYEEWTQTKDKATSLILAIGIIYLVAESLIKKRGDLLGYWSRNITFLNSFIVLGKSFAISPILEAVVKLGPFLLIVVILINWFRADAHLLKRMLGLMILGLLVSQSAGIGFGWSGTGEQFRSALANDLSAFEMVAMNAKRFESRLSLPYYEVFIEGRIGERKLIIGLKQSNIDRIKLHLDSLIREFQESEEATIRRLDAALNESRKAEQGSYGLARMLYNYFNKILVLQRLHVGISSKYTISYLLYARAASTDDLSSISQASKNIREVLELSKHTRNVGEEIGVQVSDVTQTSEFEQLYHSILIAESVEIHAVFTPMNETHVKLLLSIDTPVPLYLLSFNGNLIPENAFLQRKDLYPPFDLKRPNLPSGTHALVEFVCKYDYLRDGQLYFWGYINALVESELGREPRQLVEIVVPVRITLLYS